MISCRVSYFSMLLVAALASACGGKGGEADAYGNIETYDVTVSSEVGGKLVQLDVDEGDRLLRGQRIGLVDTVQLHFKLEQLHAQLGAARSKLQGIDAQLAVQDEQVRVIGVELGRVQRLVADSAATPRQLDDVEGRYGIAVRQRGSIAAQRGGAVAEMAAISAQLAQLKDQLGRCAILSPTQGTVVACYIREGELAAVGKPVCRVARLDTVYARIYIDETQLSEFKLGAAVRVVIDGAGGEPLEGSGVVVWVASEAEFTPKVIQTRNERVNLVYAAKVRIPNATGTYRVGMPVEVQLAGDL